MFLFCFRIWGSSRNDFVGAPSGVKGAEGFVNTQLLESTFWTKKEGREGGTGGQEGGGGKNIPPEFGVKEKWLAFRLVFLR